VELADTSAWTNRTKDDAVFADFDGRMYAGEIAACSMVVMELLWTAKNPVDFREQRSELEALPQLELTERAWTRAIDVWQDLVRRGRHRQITPPDLLIAATAELAGVGLCHYDRDFETIAEVTGQPVRAIAPLGSLS
jgi:predicted nucleic acid-binding protein